MRILLASLALVTATAFAADTEEQLLYRFDMILFEHVADGKAYTADTAAREFIDRKLEQEHAELMPVVHTDAQPGTRAEVRPATSAGPGEYTPDDPEIEYRELETGELDASLAEIRRSSKYRVLAHRSWQQLGLDDGESIRIDVQSPVTSGADATPALAGSVTFTFSRYIHLNTDLVMVHETTPAAASAVTGEIVTASTASSGQILDPANPDSGIYEPPQPDSSRIVVERKLRSRERHYIDHPLVGILVNIEREKVKTPETETGSQDAGS